MQKQVSVRWKTPVFLLFVHEVYGKRNYIIYVRFGIISVKRMKMPIFDSKKNSGENGLEQSPSGFTGEAGDRDPGSKNGTANEIYSDAHYIPLGESVDPPKYYTPSPPKEPATGRKGLSRTAVTAILCAVFAVLGCVSGAGIVSRRTEPYIQELQSKVEELSESLDGSSTEIREVPAETKTPEVIYVDPVTSEMSVRPSDIYAAACAQVVGVTTDVTYTNFFGQTSSTAVSGTGFIMSSEGYVITNYHVIEYADRYNYAVRVIMHDGSAYEAAIVGTEINNDIAVLKISAQDLIPVIMGDSDLISVGDSAYAVGNPLGELEFTMTSGTVSALNRLIRADNSSPSINMFQIDAAINSGNSGGPVYNSLGEVIGVVTAKYSENGVEGIGFAIPINDARRIAEDIIKNGYVTGKAYMGIYYDESNTSIYNRYYRNLWGSPKGVMVLGIDKNGPAKEAGIKEYDTITSIDGRSVENTSDLLNQLKRYSPGDSAEITVFRATGSGTKGESVTVTVIFAEAGSRTSANGMSIA